MAQERNPVVDLPDDIRSISVLINATKSFLYSGGESNHDMRYLRHRLIVKSWELMLEAISSKLEDTHGERKRFRLNREASFLRKVLDFERQHTILHP